jgi:hypothetical protein
MGRGLALLLILAISSCGPDEELSPGFFQAERRARLEASSTHGPGEDLRVATTHSALSTDGPVAFARDARGELFTLGHHHTPVDFGQGPLGPPERVPVLTLTRHGPAGQLRWAHLFPMPSAPGASVRAHALALEQRQGHLLLTGSQSGGLDLGTGPLPSGSFLARLDDAGHALWARHLPAPATKLLVDAAGHVTLGGVLPGAVDFGAGPVGGPQQPFLVRYTRAGGLRWVHVEAARGLLNDLAQDEAGHLYLAGARYLPSSPLPRPFFAQVSAQGSPRWTRVLEGATGVAMSVAAHGDQVVVAGQLTGHLVFRGERLEAPRGRGFALAYGVRGEERWGLLLGTSWALVDTGPGAGVLLAGRYSGQEDFGLGLGRLPGFPGSTNLYLLRLHATGGGLDWLRTYPTASALPVDLEVTPQGAALLAGTFRASVDLGTGPLLPRPGGNAFLLWLAP